VLPVCVVEPVVEPVLVPVYEPEVAPLPCVEEEFPDVLPVPDLAPDEPEPEVPPPEFLQPEFVGAVPSAHKHWRVELL